MPASSVSAPSAIEVRPLRQEVLWERLAAFSFDDPDDPLPFTQRLARDNLWPADYAARVVEEYRRFIYLVQVSEHELTPSVCVDQAWHLHMLYTQSYWDGLCGVVLGQPLHHGPTRGGTAEGGRYRLNYEKTIELYREVFGAPSADIWPAVDLRFQTQIRAVDLSRFWAVPIMFPFMIMLAIGMSGMMAIAPSVELLIIEAIFMAFACFALVRSSKGRKSGDGGGCGGAGGCGGCGGGGCGG